MRKSKIGLRRLIIVVAILLSVFISILTVLQIRDAVLNAEKVKISQVVEYVYNFIDYYNQKVEAGEITLEEAQKEVLAEAHTYTAQGGLNYVWINDYNNVMLYNPKRPIGKSCDDVIGPDGKHFYVDITNMAKEGKEKFYFYKVTRILPGKTPININKVSTAISYPKWQWVIATGVYLDEVDKIVNNAILIVLLVNFILFNILVVSVISMFRVSAIKLLNNLPFPAWYKKTDGRVIYANQVFADFVKRDLKDIVGKKIEDFYESKYSLKIKNEDNHVIETKLTSYTKEEIVVDGELKYIQNFRVPIIGFTGKVAAIAGFYLDITKEHEIEKAKNEFISVVSHELRTPLTSIIGGLDLVIKLFLNGANEKLVELVTLAEKNAVRLKKLIDDILDLNKLETGKMEFVYDDIDLDVMLISSFEEMKAYADKYGVGLRQVEKANKVVTCDESRVMQIIANLISNALKFSKEGSNVDVKTYIEDEHVILSVTNYEAPISKEFQNKIFDKFTQADASDKKSKYGSGLGLNISKKLAEKMGIDLYLTSDEKETTFYLKFPNL